MNLFGDVLGDPVPAVGRIRNLSLSAGAPGGGVAVFDFEGADPASAAIYVDGRLATVASDSPAFFSGLDDGAHNVQVIATDHAMPFHYDLKDGRRVLLRWTPAEGDVASYAIFGDTEDLPLLGTVTDRRLESRYLSYPDTGTGAGRITCDATFLPETVNGTLTLAITGSGLFTWDFGDGASDPVAFVKNDAVPIGNGCRVTFNDAPADYVTGDTWVLHAGVVCEWLSPALPPGTNQFAIVATDAWGISSSQVASGEYVIVDEPGPLTAVDVDYSAVAGQVAIAATGGDNTVSVNLYDNYDRDLGALLEYIDFDIKANSATGAFTITIAEGVSGIYRCYLRPVSAAGVELDDFTLYTIDTAAGDEVLSAPINTAAEPHTLDNWRVTWDYYFQEDDALTGFTVHRVASDGTFDYDTDLVGTVAATANGWGFAESYEFDMTGETMTGALQVQVVAHGTDNSMAGAVVTVTPVTVAPGAPASLTGGVV